MTNTLPTSISLSFVPITLLIVFAITFGFTYVRTMRHHGRLKMEAAISHVIFWCVLSSHGMSMVSQIIYRLTAPSHAPRIPLICTMGSRGPAAIFFAAGCSILSLLMLACTLTQVWRIDYHIDMTSLSPASRYHTLNYITGIMGVTSSLLFCAFTSISVATYETCHNRCARIFTCVGIIYQLAMAILTVLIEESTTMIALRFFCFGLSLFSSLASIPLIIADALHNQVARAERLAISRTPNTSVVVEMTSSTCVTPHNIQRTTTSSEGQPTTTIEIDVATSATAIATLDAPYIARSHRGSMDVVFVDFEMEMIETEAEKKKREKQQQKRKNNDKQKKQIEGSSPPHPPPRLILTCWALFQYLSLLSLVIFYGTFIPDFRLLQMINS